MCHNSWSNSSPPLTTDVSAEETGWSVPDSLYITTVTVINQTLFGLPTLKYHKPRQKALTEEKPIGKNI